MIEALLSYDQDYKSHKAGKKTESKNDDVFDYVKLKYRISVDSNQSPPPDGVLNTLFHKIFKNKPLDKYKIKEYLGTRSLHFARTHPIIQTQWTVDNGVLMISETRSKAQSEKMQYYVELLARLYDTGLVPKIDETLILNLNEKTKNLVWFQFECEKDTTDTVAKRLSKVLRKFSKLKFYDVASLHHRTHFALNYIVKHYRSGKKYMLKVLVDDSRLNPLNIDRYLQIYNELVRAHLASPLVHKTPIKVQVKHGKAPLNVYFLLCKPIKGSFAQILSKPREPEFLKDLFQHFRQTLFQKKTGYIDVSIENIGYIISNSSKRIKLLLYEPNMAITKPMTMDEFKTSALANPLVHKLNLDEITN